MSERSALDFLVTEVFGQYEIEDGERRLLEALFRDGRVAVPAGRGAGLLLRSLLVGMSLPGVALVVFGDSEAAQGLVTRLGELGVGRLGLLAEGMPDADLDRMMHRARMGAITLLLVNEALVGNPRVTAGLSALGTEPGVSLVGLDPELFRPADRSRWDTIVKTVDALTSELPGVRTLDLGAPADAAAGFDLSAEERAAIFGAMDFGVDGLDDEEENMSTVIRQSPFAAGHGAAPVPPAPVPPAPVPETPTHPAPVASRRPTDTDGESRVNTKVQPPAAAAGFDTLSRILGRAGDVPDGPGSSLFGDRSRITVEPPRVDISDEAVEKMTSKLDSLFSTSTGQTRPDIEPEDLVPVSPEPVAADEALEDLGAVEVVEDDVEVLLDDEVLLVEDEDEVVVGGLDELISTLDEPAQDAGPSSQEQALRNLADTFPTRGPAVVAPPSEHDTVPGAVSRIVLPGDLGAMGSPRRAGSVTQIVLPGDLPSVPGEEVADDELDDLLGPDLDETPAQTMDEMLEDLGVLEDEEILVEPAVARPPAAQVFPEGDDDELALVLDEDLEALAGLELVDEAPVVLDEDEELLEVAVDEAPVVLDEDEELLRDLAALEEAAASAPAPSAPVPAPSAPVGDDDVDLAELLGSLADDVVDEDEVPAGAVSRIILPDEIPVDIPGPGPDTDVILPEELEAGLAALDDLPEDDVAEGDAVGDGLPGGEGLPSPGSVSQIILPDETGSALDGLAALDELSDLGALDEESYPAHPGTVSGILLPGEGVSSPESLLDSLVPNEDGVFGAPAEPVASFKAASLAVEVGLDGMDDDPLAGLGGLDDVGSFDTDEDVTGGETLPDVLGALGNAPDLDDDSPEAIEAALRRLAEEELAEEAPSEDPFAGFDAAPAAPEPVAASFDDDSPESIEAALRRLAEDELSEESLTAPSGEADGDESPWDVPTAPAAEDEAVMGGSTLPGTRFETGEPDLDDLDSPEAIEAALRRLAEEELRDEGYGSSPSPKPVVEETAWDETAWDVPAAHTPEGGDVMGGETLPDTRFETSGPDLDDLDSPEAIEAALRRLAEEELAAEAPRPAHREPTRSAAPAASDEGPRGTFLDDTTGSPEDLDSPESIEAALRRLAEDELIDEARGGTAPVAEPEPEYSAFDGSGDGFEDEGEAILGGETLPDVHLDSGEFEDADSPEAIEAALRRLAEEELQEQGLPVPGAAAAPVPAGGFPQYEEPVFDASAEPMLDMDAFLSGLDDGEAGGGEDALVDGLVDELMVPSREAPPRATGPDDVDELLGAAEAAAASTPDGALPASSGAGGGFLDELLAQSGMDGADLALMDHPDAAPGHDAFTSPDWAMEAPAARAAVSPDDLDLDALLDGPAATAAPSEGRASGAMVDDPDLGALVSGLGVDEAGPRDSSVGAVSRVILPGEDTAGLDPLDVLDGLGGPTQDEFSDALDALDDLGGPGETVPAAGAAATPRGPMVDEPDLGALVGGLGFDEPDARDEEEGAVSRIILADEDGLSALDQFLARQEEEASAAASPEPEPEPVPEPEDLEGLAALDDLASGLEFGPAHDESIATGWDALPEPDGLAEPELELPAVDSDAFGVEVQPLELGLSEDASPLEAALDGIDDGAVLADVEPGAETADLPDPDAFEFEPEGGQQEWASDEDGALAAALAEAEAVLRDTDLDSLSDDDFPMAADSEPRYAAAASQAARDLVIESSLDEQSAYLAEQADELAREGRGYERPASAGKALVGSSPSAPEDGGVETLVAESPLPASPPVPPPPRRVPASHDLSPAIRRLVLGTEGDLQRVASTYELLAKGGEEEPTLIEGELRSLEELFPTDERVLFALSLVEMGRRRAAEGVSYAMRAAKRCRSVEDTPNEAFIYSVLHERYPDDLGVVDRLAETLVALGHSDDAAARLTSTADRLMTSGAVEDAVALYDRALTVAPDDDELFERLLGACRSAGRESQALELVNARLADRPRSVDLNLQKAISLQALGRTDKADKTFRAAFDLVWDNPFRLVELEQTLDEYGCREQQESVRRRILEIDPANMTVAEKLAREERLRSLERDAPVIEDMLPMDEPVEITDGDALLAGDLDGDEPLAAAEAEANDIFSRAARVSPKFAALVDDLRNLEEELQVADGAESVADRFLAELVRKFMDVGERVGSDHPTEALELYERSRSYLGLFKDPTALFLWQEQLDRRIDTTRSRVH